MSVLGSYVHLNAENYLTYGIGRKVKKQAGYSIAGAHRRMLEHIQKVSVADQLKAMEKYYNEQSQKEYESLKKLCEDPDTKLAFVKTLIRGANGVPNRFLNDPNFLNRLADAIEFSDGQQNIKINAAKILTSKSFAPLTGTQWRSVDALIRRTQAIIRDSAGSTDVNIQKIYKEASNILAALTAYMTANGNKQKIYFSLPNTNPRKRPSALAESPHRINPQVGQLVAAELENMQATIAINNYEPDLQAAFAELLGPIVSDQAATVAEQKIAQNLTETLSTWLSNYSGPGQQSIPQRVSNSMYITLSSKALGEIANTPGAQQKRYQGMLIKDPITGYWVDFALQVGGKQDQKIDATITFKSKEYGISVKNIDLSKDISYSGKAEDKGVITLQGSSDSGTSLLMFLVGLNDFEQDLGNHALNLLAEHEDEENATIIAKRASVIALLTTQMMWSALTGEFQGKQQKSAQILEIYDKDKNGVEKIKLFDMTMIFNSARLNNGIIITPAIANLKTDLLYNMRVTGTNNDIQRRLTLLLFDARQRRFSMTLKKSLLRDLQKQKG